MLVLALAAGCIDMPEDVGWTAQTAPVTEGTLALADPAVVAIVARPLLCGEVVPTAICTGTLIAERAVLTAGHCVEGVDAPSEVVFGSEVGGGDSVTRHIVGVVRHPGYTRDSSDNDLAIVWLDGPAPCNPVPLADGTSLPSPPALLRILGFGQTRNPTQAEGLKREGVVQLSSLAERTLVYGPSPSMTCGGDSGGPVFFEIAGTEQLVAVTSAGDPDCASSGIATRVDAALVDFILPTLAAAPPEEGVGLSCTDTCSGDLDCLPGLVCREARDGVNRCALSGFEPGELNGPCSSSTECGANPCVVASPGCRCYSPCEAPDSGSAEASTGPDPKHPDAGGTGIDGFVAGGGCAIGALPARNGAEDTWGAIGVLLCGLAAARRKIGAQSRGASLQEPGGSRAS